VRGDMNGIAEKVISGDIRTVAKLIRDIDDKVPEAREFLKDLYPFTGKSSALPALRGSGKAPW
jgi:LAO/AO transport system kinase